MSGSKGWRTQIERRIADDAMEKKCLQVAATVPSPNARS
jgi:hypothetical protein